MGSAEDDGIPDDFSPPQPSMVPSGLGGSTFCRWADDIATQPTSLNTRPPLSPGLLRTRSQLERLQDKKIPSFFTTSARWVLCN